MNNILFVCTGNTCRSPMAEHIFNKKAKEKGINYEVKSCGVAAFGSSSASENAIKALNELGIDLSVHKSKMITQEDIACADVILTMTNSHKHHILQYFGEFSNKVYTVYEYALSQKSDISDPFMGSIEIYRSCRDELNKLLEIIIKKLLEEI
ncbi:MAG: low molecular weight protein arginine phosphatase [Defluviitaleaceae bacterium]|nr:low molecular weight protein arginine phosphatase [Defluviitaleaceae bacterium]